MIKVSDVRIGDIYYWPFGRVAVRVKVLSLPYIDQKYNQIMILTQGPAGQRDVAPNVLYKTKKEVLNKLINTFESCANFQAHLRDSGQSYDSDLLKANSLSMYQLKRQFIKDT